MEKINLQVLSRAVTIWAFITGIICITICSLIQFTFFSNASNIVEFMKHDLMHILIYGVISFISFFIFIRLLIIPELYRIYRRLYSVSYCHSNRGEYVMEKEDFDAIMTGINHLINIQEKEIECTLMQETQRINTI